MEGRFVWVWIPIVARTRWRVIGERRGRSGVPGHRTFQLKVIRVSPTKQWEVCRCADRDRVYLAGHGKLVEGRRCQRGCHRSFLAALDSTIAHERASSAGMDKVEGQKIAIQYAYDGAS